MKITSELRWIHLKLKSRFIICLIVCLLSSSMADGLNYSDVDLLDELFYTSVNENLPEHHTGQLFNISLPSNYSGMHLSAIRLRSGTFWARGANYNSINIPPRIATMPYAKRLAIVYENLGNWSSSYFAVRNYSMVTPVVGFTVYDASNLTKLGDEEVLGFSFMGDDPITITFPNFEVADKNVTTQCASFGLSKTIQITNVSGLNACTTKVSGRFAIIIPSLPPPPEGGAKQTGTEKWWVSVFGVMVVLILAGLVIYKVVKMRKMKKMESEAEKGVAFDTIWIRGSKMPAAAMVRTQPALENEYVP
ncbi:uncharacterized protein LOC123216039 [Mangifera indica]|uniref:uncharacterized protein LOC123216039 n=1 Tax=Mangifera indica TaxID=29780 RepID=UPI001CFBAFBD|nr:uncharacterized protein LOC123216039 [Mangifera indica]